MFNILIVIVCCCFVSDECFSMKNTGQQVLPLTLYNLEINEVQRIVDRRFQVDNNRPEVGGFGLYNIDRSGNEGAVLSTDCDMSQFYLMSSLSGVDEESTDVGFLRSNPAGNDDNQSFDANENQTPYPCGAKGNTQYDFFFEEYLKNGGQSFAEKALFFEVKGGGYIVIEK